MNLSKIINIKKKCFNCKRKEPFGLKVKHKGKIRWWCDSCFDGYLIEQEEKKQIS